MQNLIRLIVVVIVSFRSVGLAQESDTPERLADQSRSLQGHDGVEVYAQITPIDHAESLGIKERTLQEFAIDRLKSAGIKTVGKPAARPLLAPENVEPDVVKRPASSDLSLEIRVRFHRGQAGVRVVHLRTAAIQAVQISRNGQKMLVSTWAVSSIGTLAEATELKSAVEEQLNTFIAAWKKAHQPAAK